MICCPLLMNVCQVGGWVRGWLVPEPLARTHGQVVVVRCQPRDGGLPRREALVCAGPAAPPRRCHPATHTPPSFPLLAPQVLVQDLVLKFAKGRGAGTSAGQPQKEGLELEGAVAERQVSLLAAAQQRSDALV